MVGDKGSNPTAQLDGAPSDALAEKAYEQNYIQFRSLNQIMWQIPVLAMTLTGGLWFGVAQLEKSPWLQGTLLLTALLGNLSLLVVLRRFRHVMSCYLEWLQAAAPNSFVDATKKSSSKNWLLRWMTGETRVRDMFSFMLFWSAAASLFLMIATIWGNVTLGHQQKLSSISYYDEHAVELADNYESISFEAAYPFLVQELTSAPLMVLDVGAGTGRDAAWLAGRGHSVYAAEPSSGMRRIARSIHRDAKINWSDASLPNLDSRDYNERMFDVVLLNAVWMHIVPEDREAALKRLFSLMKINGRLYVSLRIGPDERKRGFFPVESSEFIAMAKNVGFSVEKRQTAEDLLGRAGVYWEMYELTKI